ncbi:MAG: 30S ribosomal protein S17 [candidate division TM6 bacterium GW2011_GWE2_41_16]|nr:MAG: 30S ribosomal protein S17 [candidate division TM6 bacterium GW2011_GWE2_41_16]
MIEKKEAPRRTLYVGTVISDKMDKTIVVKIERTQKHPVYGKVVRIAKKYKVHDEEGKARTGDVVEFFEGKPTSKTKYMYLARIIKSHTA